MLPSKDVNFVGYTYKNFEIVNDHEIPGIGIYKSLSLSLYIYVCVCVPMYISMCYNCSTM